MDKSYIFNKSVNLNESEIRRILSLHELATKNHYLLENDTTHQQNTIQQTTDKPKNIRGFQIWLNKNVPTWYDGGKLTKGFGVFGPKTSAAWSHYKDTYLKSGGK
jgi:hypothetical protein